MTWSESTPRIGVDESGKGDYFGPLVIAACFVGPEHLAALEGVRDSKTVTDTNAGKLAANIKAACPHTIITVLPPKYNELYAKIGNLNRLLEWGHAHAIADLLAKDLGPELAISDQFANPAGLRKRLAQKECEIPLVSVPRAESDLAVAAASILARAEFLRRLKQLGEEIGVPLPKGAGSPVEAAARQLVRERGREALPKVAKMHFKTTQKVLDS